MNEWVPNESAFMSRLLAFFAALALAAGAHGFPFPKPDAKAPEPPKAEPKDDKPGEADDIDVQKTAERIADNAQKAGERLKEKDPGEETRKIQQDILKDIDALLKKAQQPAPPSDMPPPMPPMNPPPKSDNPMPKSDNPMPKDNAGGSGSQPMTGQPQGSGGGSQSKSGSSGSGGSSNGMADRRPRKERRPQGGNPTGAGDPQAKDGPGGQEPLSMKPEPKDGPMRTGQEKAGNQGGRPKTANLSPKRQSDKLADLYKDVWGSLPDRMRQEMDLYYREQFMPRYSELLRQYYAALAEQRKKGSEDR
jgi:hypothetical protein